MFGAATKSRGSRKRDREATRSRALSAGAREVGPLPPVQNQARRDATRLDLREFCTTYFPGIFFLKFSPDHERVIAKLQTAILTGGLFAMALPRGGGKTPFPPRPPSGPCCTATVASW